MILLIVITFLNTLCFSIDDFEAQNIIQESSIAVQYPSNPRQLIPTLCIDPLNGSATCNLKGLNQQGYSYKSSTQENTIHISIQASTNTAPLLTAKICKEKDKTTSLIQQLTLPAIEFIYNQNDQIEQLSYLNPKTHQLIYSMYFVWQDDQIIQYTTFDKSLKPLFQYNYEYTSDKRITKAIKTDLQKQLSYSIEYSYDDVGRLTTFADNEDRFYEWSYEKDQKFPIEEFYAYKGSLRTHKKQKFNVEQGTRRVDLYRYSDSKDSVYTHFIILYMGQNRLDSPVHEQLTQVYIKNEDQFTLVYTTEAAIHPETQTQFLSQSSLLNNHHKRQIAQPKPLKKLIALGKNKENDSVYESNQKLSLTPETSLEAEKQPLASYLRNLTKRWLKSLSIEPSDLTDVDIINIETCSAGQPLVIHYNDGSVELFCYDIHGMLTSFTNKDGFRVQIERDDKLRPICFKLTEPSTNSQIDSFQFNYQQGLLSGVDTPHFNLTLKRDSNQILDRINYQKDETFKSLELSSNPNRKTYYQRLKDITQAPSSKKVSKYHSLTFFENTYTVLDALYDTWDFFFGESNDYLETEKDPDKPFDLLEEFLNFENNFNQVFNEPVEYFLKRIFGETLSFISGLSVEEMVEGCFGNKPELPHLRLSAINGILNSHQSARKLVGHISKSHKDYPVHYLFTPTHGFSQDMFKALEGKLEIHSDRSHRLSELWAKLIHEMYEQIEEPDLVPTLIHFAHSLGGLDSYLASLHLSDIVKSHIRVNTFGSARLISSSDGFQSIKNYICYRDIVPMTDLIHYVIHIVRQDDDTVFVGDFFGIPFIDHFFFNGTYEHIAIEIADKVVEEFGL